MPKVEKVLRGEAAAIAAKAAVGITSFGSRIVLRDKWEAEADGKRCIVQVYEKLAPEPGHPHYGMTVVFFDLGEEVRLFATTTGGSNQYWGSPYPDGEGELTCVLDTVLNVLDDIVM